MNLAAKCRSTLNTKPDAQPHTTTNMTNEDTPFGGGTLAVHPYGWLLTRLPEGHNKESWQELAGLSLKVTEESESTKRPTQKSQRSYQHTNTKNLSPLTCLSQTTIVQDALSIQGRPLCWKMISAKMQVISF